MERFAAGALLRSALAIVLIGAIAGPAAAQVTPSEQDAMLAAHNQLRRTVAAAETARLGQPVTIPDLTWSTEAAAVAQAWADTMLATDTFEHNADRGPFGENIYWEAGLDPATSAARAAANWAAEQADYTWDTDSCGDVCGHYTQMVWAATTSVGCGVATDGTQTYWVCDYAPPGNFTGERPYEPGVTPAPAPSSAPGPVATAEPAPVATAEPAPVATAEPAPVATTAPEPFEQDAMLAAHNQLRRTVAAAETARLGQPVTIPDLTWSTEAAAVAQAWADTMLATDTFEHNADRGPFGENIYWEAGLDPATSAARAAANWAAEQADYTWDTDSCGDVCGHYTQMVWAATTSVGCGVATDGTQTYWVCDYAPPGNFTGERPYEPGVTPAPAPSSAPGPVATAEPAPVATAEPAPVATAEPAPAATTAPEPTPSSAPEPVATAEPAPVATTTPAPVPAAVDPMSILAAHNQLRRTVAAAETARLGQPVTIPDLTWSTEAAAVAQAWADRLIETNTFEHNADRGPFGENVYAEWGLDPSTSGDRAAANWAAEQADYTWDTDSCGDVCGHYTQMVWAATTSVGCGVATDGSWIYWVCDYAPPGNFTGERPYEPETPAAAQVESAPPAEAHAEPVAPEESAVPPIPPAE